MAYRISRSMRVHDDLEDSNFESSEGYDEVEPTQVPQSSLKKVEQDKHEKIAGKPLITKVLPKVFFKDYGRVKNKIFDPRGLVIHKWNKIFFVACLVSLFVDPLFFYLLEVHKEMCLNIGKGLEVVLMVLRSLLDIFYIVQILVRLRTAYIAPSSRVLGKGELVIDPSKIALRYLGKGFWVDVIASLPLPQVMIWAAGHTPTGLRVAHTINIIRFTIVVQYVPRLFLIFPLSKQIEMASGVVTQTGWGGAAYNMMIYMLASNVIGACWYLLSIERHEFCWREVCHLDSASCQNAYFDCRNIGNLDRIAWFESSNITEICTPNNDFTQYGIYGPVISLNIPSLSFFYKYVYCLWWGLQNLGALGQNLVTSIYIGENCFGIIISVLGLILFALQVGNMQRYLLSTTIRLEEWRMKQRDTEQWMSHKQLPLELRQNIRRYDQFKWTATRGVNEEALLKGFPVDLRRDIKRHLCLDLVRRVPLFDEMDIRTLDAICERLKPVLCTQSTYLVREGDLVNEMLFIIRGNLDSFTTNGGQAGFYNSCRIGPGDFCGEELLTWVLDSHLSSILPSSNRTVKSISEVEAFALSAEDLKFVASQFRRLHSKELRHKLRFYSNQWKTWAACFIQESWRRFKKRKEAAALVAKENPIMIDPTLLPLIDMTVVPPPGSSLSVYAARFISNSRRAKIEKLVGGLDFSQGGSMEKPLEPNFAPE